MDILEGRRCVLPALQARQRKIQLVLLKQNAAPTRIAEIVELAESHNVPVKFAPQSEIDALTQGRSHGGIAAICHPKEPLAGKALIELIEKTDEPAFLLLIEGTEDAQNLGYTLRTAEAMGVHAVLLKKHVWSFDSANAPGRPPRGIAVASGSELRFPASMIRPGVATRTDAGRENDNRGARKCGKR